VCATRCYMFRSCLLLLSLSLLSYSIVVWYFFFFFFQAEDGIRDDLVTGVQTCALPIFSTTLRRRAQWRWPAYRERRGNRHRALRSEERRVGKECRSRWSTYH